MVKNLYIASLEPNSGKLVVTLGIMEMLSSRVDRLGFFRTIINHAPEKDNHFQLINKRLNLSLDLEQMYGVSHD